MNVRYPPDLKRSGVDWAHIERATKLLEGAVVGAFQPLEAEWSRVSDRQGRTLDRLTIRDSIGEVSTDFSADEIANPLHMKVRIYRLWGGLLKIHSDRQRQVVEDIVAQIGAG